MIISFAKTVDEFLSGKKTETRRDWKYRHFLMWRKFWWKNNCFHEAFNKSPRAGGEFIGIIRLTAKPYRQQLKDMTPENLIAEGGMCKTVDEFCKFIGKSPKDWVTVITFEKI